MRRIIILLFYILMFFIIIQYYDNAFQKFYFLMQFLPICYRIHRSSYLKYGGPDPAGPRAPKSGGSADPADPVVPTPLSLTAEWRKCRPADFRQDKPCTPNSSVSSPQMHSCGAHTGAPRRNAIAILNDESSSLFPTEEQGTTAKKSPE